MAPPRTLALIEVDELELEIEKLVAGGEGLGRYQGIPIFVPRSAPGDRLRVRLEERQPDYARAEIVEILRPAPERRDPPCPYFERCGGCDLQHLEDDDQLRLKAEAVRETLERVGGVVMPDQIQIIASPPWGYRLRTQLHAAETERGIEVGYFARGSQDLVAVDRCPILQPELEAVLPDLPQALQDSPRRRVDLASGDDGGLTFAPVIPGLPHGAVTQTVGDHVYRFDARCFFQANRPLLGALVKHAIGPWEGETAFDLYAGVGLFSLPLARRYATVVAVEGERIAARYARINARENKIKNLEIENRSLENWLGSLPERSSRILVDPPRAGLSKPLRIALRHRRPERLTYVSCHAATLARDLRVFGDAYRLESLVLLDLFPQTGHMEVIAQLVKEAGGDEASGDEAGGDEAGGDESASVSDDVG